MFYTVSDRQSLLDVALVTLGSVAGVFALVERNGLPVSAKLADGQQIAFELEDVVSPAVRSAYAVQGICPATDIDRLQYNELLYLTGTRRPPLSVRHPALSDPDRVVVDKLDEVIGMLDRGEEVRPVAPQQFTRIFDNPFSEIFS